MVVADDSLVRSADVDGSPDRSGFDEEDPDSADTSLRPRSLPAIIVGRLNVVAVVGAFSLDGSDVPSEINGGNCDVEVACSELVPATGA